MSQRLASHTRKPSKTKQPLLLAISMLIANSANSAELCQRFRILTEQARSNFVDSSAEVTVTGTLQTLPDAESCALSRSLSGGNAYHCMWKFHYRDDAASAAFDAFNQMVRSCFEGSSETVTDEGVNHPDTYFQRQHFLDQVIVSISIKDKSELQETNVFVGIQSAKID